MQFLTLHSCGKGKWKLWELGDKIAVMNIKIVCVGKLKEKYFKDAIAEYQKRLSRFAKVQVIEVPDEKAPEKFSAAEQEKVKNYILWSLPLVSE